ncbi:MAG TPA: xanthine dehydrogenase family protein subunit M, partial [Candidatus Dormibacteraeota bacterium]|nr:xanthine dehydrogenase family protein subunit M [Candidatus Dormibacteraeota bacterium]
WNEFLIGPKRNALKPDELITGATWPAIKGAGSFSKVGTRNAMVIAVVGLCLVLDQERRQIRVALGSVGPTIIRARDAEQLAGDALSAGKPIDVAEFAEHVAGAAKPIDDVRGTADYRRHACRVLAARAVNWALSSG